MVFRLVSGRASANVLETPWPVDLEVNASVVWWNWNIYGSSNGIKRLK
jgi:hypothetical protein